MTALVDELRGGRAEFARLWERHDVRAAPMPTTTSHHPILGVITVDRDGLMPPGHDQHLVLHDAPTGSPDAPALALR